MWPVPEVHVFLPEHLHASEDTDFLVIRCSLCGWSTWFSVRGVSREEIQRAVEEHHPCPAGAAGGPKHPRRPRRRRCPCPGDRRETDAHDHHAQPNTGRDLTRDATEESGSGARTSKCSANARSLQVANPTDARAARVDSGRPRRPSVPDDGGAGRRVSVVAGLSARAGAPSPPGRDRRATGVAALNVPSFRRTMLGLIRGCLIEVDPGASLLWTPHSTGVYMFVCRDLTGHVSLVRLLANTSRYRDGLCAI
jgi:hypothetical protein